jgi:hypothetical protein
LSVAALQLAVAELAVIELKPGVPVAPGAVVSTVLNEFELAAPVFPAASFACTWIV